MIDPLEGQCGSLPQIYVPEAELRIAVIKPDVATASFLFANNGEIDLAYKLQQIGSASLVSWNVTPSAGNLSRDDAIETVTFALDSEHLQARAKEYITKFSLISNSGDAADRNVTIITQVSADPIARLSRVTLDNPSDVVAGGSLLFHLNLMDVTGIEILDASNVAFSAMLTHQTSTTDVACSVLYDTSSGWHKGACDLPALVCSEGTSLGECDLSPPIGPLTLEVNDTQGMLIGASRYPIEVKICPASYYRSGDSCVICPKHVTCKAGSTIADWELAAGHWRSHDESTDVRECRFTDVSCPGPGNGANHATGPDSYCAPMYTGPLCSQCKPNFFMSWVGDGKCQECEAGKSHHPTIGLLCGVVVSCALLSASLRKCLSKKAEAVKKGALFPKIEKLIVLAKVKVFTLFLTSQV